MNITSSISSFLSNAKQPALGTIKRVWAVQPSIWSADTITDCIEVVVYDDGDVLVNHLVELTREQGDTEPRIHHRWRPQPRGYRGSSRRHSNLYQNGQIMSLTFLPQHIKL